MGIPLTLNFLGEQLSLIGIWDRSPIIAILGSLTIVLSSCYSMFLFNRLCYGQQYSYIYQVLDIDRREFMLLLSLLIPTILFGIFPNIILDNLHLSITSLLYNIPF
jgi:NADH-ubiquinone oxidoreductase chain 4